MKLESRQWSAALPDRCRLPVELAGLWLLLLSNSARLVRFAVVGGICGLIQLGLLVLFLRAGWQAVAANVAAYLLSAQVNFYLSNRFIWHDRWSRDGSLRDLCRRWARFHLSIAGTFVLNQLVFIVARGFLPDVLASAAGIGSSALANFIIQDRLTFQRMQRNAHAKVAARRLTGRC